MAKQFHVEHCQGEISFYFLNFQMIFLVEAPVFMQQMNHHDLNITQFVSYPEYYYDFILNLFLHL